MVFVDAASAARAVPLRNWLDRVHEMQIEIVRDRGWLRRMVGDGVIVALVDEHPLTVEAEQAIAAHLARGGGLVLLGSTLHAWRDTATLTSVVGKPGQRQPRTEIVVEVTGHPALRRMEPSLTLIDHAWLDAAVPPEADTWLRTSWHFREQVLGWSCGRAVVLTLGNTAEACADERVARLVLRAVRHAAGCTEPAPVRIGLLGWGAIGAEHATAIAAVDGLELVAVCDRDPARLSWVGAAWPHVRLLADAGALASDDGVDLVLVSVPPHRHAQMSIWMLRAGKHVVVEKPFALTRAEAEEVIAAAVAAQRSLTVYQNRRWDPDFRTVRGCVHNGRVGDVFHVETFVGAFAHPCRYWHSHEPVSGGLIYDWGSHYLDWILQLVDAPVAAVSGARHKRVWHDVTNADMARVSIRFQGGQEAEFIHSDVAAAPKPKWYVLGTRGAVTAEWRQERRTEQSVSGELIHTPLARTDAQAAVLVHTPDGMGGAHVETLTLPLRLDAPFHRNLADHLLTGEPLEITPAQAHRTTAVLEAANRSAHDSGAPVHLNV